MFDSSSEQRELWDEIAASYRPEDSEETEAIAPTLNFLAELAGSGHALEFAIGGGRMAAPAHGCRRWSRPVEVRPGPNKATAHEQLLPTLDGLG